MVNGDQASDRSTSDWDLGTVLSSLSKYPHLIASIFDPIVENRWIVDVLRHPRLARTASVEKDVLAA